LGDRIRVRLTAPPCNVLSYGAKGDGVHNDTAAVQVALTACSASPGGSVLLPAGYTFLTSALAVPSTSSFGLEIAGTLRFQNNTAAWPNGQSCLQLNGGSGIALFGGGLVDGQGAAWWPNPNAFRPDLVLAQGVSQLLITNLTFLNSPNHNLELFANDQEVSHTTVLAPPSPISHNTDAIDVHGAPAWIHDCYFSVGDDNLALHANDTLAENNVFGYGHGASIGSLGGAVALQNITVRATSFNGTTQGVRIKSDEGASGYLTNVTYSNLTMSGVGTTVLLTMYYSNCSTPCNTTLAISNVTIAGVTAVNSGLAGQLLCIPEAPCEGITIADVRHSGAPPQPWQCQAVYGTTTGDVPAVGCMNG
jgi:polygalacturonase